MSEKGTMVKLKSGRVGDDVKRHFGGKEKKSGSAGAGRIQFIPKTGGITVRFQTDSEEWQWYEEYWDTALNKPVLATEENEDEYAERGIRASIRYLAAAINVADNRAMAIKLPYSLAQDVKAMEEKYLKKGWKLTDYDVELSREGESTDTTYRAMFDGQTELDLSRYKVVDLFQLLLDQLDPQENSAEAIDNDDEDDEEETKAAEPVKKSFKLPKRG